MMNVGPMEIILVLAVALLILGPKKLPDAGRSLGRGMREFKDSLSGGGGDRDDETSARTEAPAELR
jgi:sec-independent protein translocase protein TatA